ncbi:hypothetical protein Tco_1564098 [Tanacetum coccineum]
MSEEIEAIIEQVADGCMYTSDEDNARLWHERMGHPQHSMETLQKTEMVRDICPWNGYLRKGQKTKPNRQNRTRNGKAGKDKVKVQAQA